MSGIHNMTYKELADNIEEDYPRQKTSVKFNILNNLYSGDFTSAQTNLKQTNLYDTLLQNYDTYLNPKTKKPLEEIINIKNEKEKEKEKKENPEYEDTNFNKYPALYSEKLYIISRLIHIKKSIL